MPNKLGNSMLPHQVRLKGHHKNRTWFCYKVAGELALGVEQTKDTDLAEREGHNRCSLNHILRTIVMQSDVVTKRTVIPIQKKTIETYVNLTSYPFPEWF